MSLHKVQKDRDWFIVEEHLRFEGVDALVPPSIVPVLLLEDLEKSIDVLERLRGWKEIQSVPTHRRIKGAPCCIQITGKAGAPLKRRFYPSAAQGRSDDLHNSMSVVDQVTAHSRVAWIAVVHFWTPSITVDPDETREWKQSLTPANGFVTPDRMPRPRDKGWLPSEAVTLVDAAGNPLVSAKE